MKEISLEEMCIIREVRKDQLRFHVNRPKKKGYYKSSDILQSSFKVLPSLRYAEDAIPDNSHIYMRDLSMYETSHASTFGKSMRPNILNMYKRYGHILKQISDAGVDSEEISGLRDLSSHKRKIYGDPENVKK